jgi:hypothetical protein
MYSIVKAFTLTALLLSTVTAEEAYIVKDHAQKSTYVDGKREGMTWWYNDKGAVKSKVNFDNGKENGLYTSYYDNGKIKLTVHYVNGQKHELQKIYYDNGQLGSQVNYIMGRREGVMTEWDSEGFKSSEVFYKRNYKVGLKKYYDHSGKVTMTQEFKMDRNPVMVKLLKDKQKETLIDLAKYGLMPEDTPEKERMR